MARFFQTGDRVPVTAEQPPRPGLPPVCPSREEFARTYYSGTPVSSVPNHLLPLSCYMANLLTFAQTCRERDVPGTDPLVVLLRVRRARSHRFTEAAVLLVFLMVVLLVVLLLSTGSNVGRLISGMKT